MTYIINDTMGTKKITAEWKILEDLTLKFTATSVLSCISFSGFFRKKRGEIVGLALRLSDHDVHLSSTQRHVVTFPNSEAGSTLNFSWYLDTEEGKEYRIAVEAQHSASGSQMVQLLWGGGLPPMALRVSAL